MIGLSIQSVTSGSDFRGNLGIGHAHPPNDGRKADEFRRLPDHFLHRDRICDRDRRDAAASDLILRHESALYVGRRERARCSIAGSRGRNVSAAQTTRYRRQDANRGPGHLFGALDRGDFAGSKRTLIPTRERLRLGSYTQHGRVDVDLRPTSVHVTRRQGW